MLITSLFARHTYDCNYLHNYAENISYLKLKDQKLIKPNDVIENKTKSVLIASEKINKNLYKDVHLITFFLKNNTTIKVISINYSSPEECSMSDVEVYLIKSKISGNED
jgi:hypothetical protein